MPTIVKERIYYDGTTLQKCTGNYSISATDVRYVKFDHGTYTMKLVWSAGKKVSQLVQEHGADYGFNFPFFWNNNPIADCKIGNTILSQGYDTVGGAQQTTWHGLSYKNGQPSIGKFNINDTYQANEFLVKTTPLLLNGQGSEVWDWYRVQEGTAPDIGKDTNGNYVRAQRTFIGTDAAGNFHLAVGDGRTSYDRGLDLREMALYMKEKGCLWALNGDGGSSSVLADKTGSLGQNQGAAERAVNHAILIFMNPVDPLKPLRDAAAELKNQVLYMDSLIDGSGSGTEQWSLNYLKQVYDIMKSQGLL